MSITKSAGMIMRALIEEGSEANAKAMQDLALAEGAYPKHLLTALFTDIAPASRGLERKALANRWVSPVESKAIKTSHGQKRRVT